MIQCNYFGDAKNGPSLSFISMTTVPNYNKLGLKTTEMYCLQFWRPKVQNNQIIKVTNGFPDQNQGVGRATLPPEAVKENLFLAFHSFWWLPAFLDLELHHSSLYLHGHIAFLLCSTFLV